MWCTAEAQVLELRPRQRARDQILRRVRPPVGEAAKSAPAPEPRSYTPKHLAEKILRSRGALEGERKHVTVLFADVKGSLELAEQLDPVAWHGIMDRFFQLLADGVHRFEGTAAVVRLRPSARRAMNPSATICCETRRELLRRSLVSASARTLLAGAWPSRSTSASLILTSESVITMRQ
jgi:class 3 adenylate cyclase